MQDITFAIRMLLKRPGLSVVAILTLAFGIGANTAIFSVINAVLLRPMPFANPDRLVMVWGSNPEIGTEEASLPDYMDWKNESTSFEGLGAIANRSVNITGQGDPTRVAGARITYDFMSVLGVQPMIGRDFTKDDDTPGAPSVVVLSNSFWQTRYGGDPNIVGQAIQVNGVPYEIVGVMPASFRIPIDEPALFAPLAEDLATASRRNDYLVVIGRLKPSATVESAQTELAGVMQRLEQQFPQTNAGWSVAVVPVHEQVVENFRLALFALLGAVGCVLLIACANVANLLLARAETRHKEMAIRAALGAGRWRLVRQMLVESLILAILGGGLGLLVAVWGKEFLLAVSPVSVPRMDEASLDVGVLGFALGLSVVTGLLFGLVPAVHAARADLNDALKLGFGKGAGGGSPIRLRSVLVATQLCLAFVLLVGMGLMIRSFQTITDVNPGFDVDNLLTVRITLPPEQYKDDQQAWNFFSELRDRVAASPGVVSASYTNAIPVEGGGGMYSFTEEGVPPPPPEAVIDTNARVVSPDYHQAMGIPLKAGRLLTDQDRDGGNQVILINETMAKRFWPGQNPIGKRITFGGGSNVTWLEIVGVVGDIENRGLAGGETRAIYGSCWQRPVRSLALVVRTENDPSSVVSAIRNNVRALDPNLPVYNIRTMDEILSRSVRPQRFGMLLLIVFGVLALSLAAIGVYSVISYSVIQRTHEIGIRMALGARHRDVLAMVIRQGMAMAGAGLAVGAVLAALLTKSLSSMFYGVGPFDPIVYVGAAVVFAVVAFLACGLPARRAARVDPMIALRYE